MEKLFTDLAWKCYQYNLRFEYVPVSEGVTVFNEKYEFITAGWLDGIAEKELNHMHKEVDLYLKSIEPEERETEYAQAKLTECERGHKNAGVKQEDYL